MEDGYIQESEPVTPEEWSPNDGVGETGEASENAAYDSDGGESGGGSGESETGADADRDDAGEILELLNQLLEERAENQDFEISQGKVEGEETAENQGFEESSDEEAAEEESENADFTAILDDIDINTELIIAAIEESTEQRVQAIEESTAQLVVGLGIMTIGIGFLVGLLIIRLLLGRLMNGGDNG